MKTFTVFCCIVLFAGLGPVRAQYAKKIYEAPGLKEKIAAHQTVAILPFDFTIRYKRLPKNVTEEMIAEQQRQDARNIQASMYTFLLRKIGDYAVSFQDVARTNALLNKLDISTDNIGSFTKDELCRILEVDAVISGSVLTDRPLSESAAIAIGVVTGLWLNDKETDTVITLHNGTDGELLWRFDRTVAGNSFNTTDQLVNIIMRQVARNFPYSK